MNDTFRVTLNPDKVAVAMASKGYGTTELAKAVGKSRQIVHLWLNSRTLNPKQAGAIAKALEVDVKELI